MQDPGRSLNITEPDNTELHGPIEQTDNEFDRLKEEAEQRPDRATQVEREIQGDEEIPQTITKTGPVTGLWPCCGRSR